MTGYPILPIDVFEAIIDQASDHGPSLRHLSLISRTLQPRARYHLFSSISVRSVEQLQSAAVFFDTHPWIPPLVRKVSLSPGPLSGDHWNHVQNVPLLDITPFHVLSRLPNLRTWKLELLGSPMYTGGPWLSFHRSTLSCYSRYGGRIRALELSYIPFDGISDFLCLVSAFTSIQTMTCSYVRFRISTEIKPFVSRSGPSTLARPLNISRLHVSDSVDFRAVGYLLASSGATLKDLVLTLKGDMSHYSLEQPEKAIQAIWFSQLSSLTLILPYYGGFQTLRDADAMLSHSINYAIKLLARVESPHMCDVRVEFRLHASSLAILGTCLSRPSAMLEACKPLEGALIPFHLGRMSVHSSVAHRRAGRAAFWSPVFKSTFPLLGERRLLDLDARADARDPVGHEGAVDCMVASYDSKWIATGSMDGTIIVWDAERGKIVHEWLAHRGLGVHALSFSPDGQRLVSAGDDETEGLAVWHIGVDGVRRVAAPVGHTQAITACVWSPDGALIASTSKDDTVRIWDALTFQQLDQVHRGDLTGLALYLGHLQFSPDSQCLAWVSRSSSLHIGCNIWRPQSSKALKQIFPSELSMIDALSFDLEGKRIATANSPASTVAPNIVQIWDIATGMMLAALAGHSSRIMNVSFSPDGRSILSASLDGSAKIWDAISGAQRASLHVYQKYADTIPAPVATACFSPDGKFVATVAESLSTVQLWRTDNASCIAEFIGHRGADISRVTFSPNGEFLASGDVDGIVVIRRLPSSLLY